MLPTSFGQIGAGQSKCLGKLQQGCCPYELVQLFSRKNLSYHSHTPIFDFPTADEIPETIIVQNCHGKQSLRASVDD
jgi:hypothetical protein